MTAPDLPAGMREALAEALAAHQSEQLWKQGGWVGDTACSCGWRMAMWSRKDFPETHRKHLADALLPVLARTKREWQAEAWDEGFERGYDAATYEESGARRDNPYTAEWAAKQTEPA